MWQAHALGHRWTDFGIWEPHFVEDFSIKRVKVQFIWLSEKQMMLPISSTTKIYS